MKGMSTNKILLVEDDQNFGDVLKSYLEMHEYDVTLAPDGVAGLESFKRGSFDLCIFDVMMPRKDGFTLAKEVREKDKDMPIIFLTAKDDTRDRIEGFRSGIDAYITKPFEPDELVAVIRSILERVERTRTAFATLTGSAVEKEEVLVRDTELSDAEWRVAEAIARGLTNKEIAAELNLSIRTVESHVSRILGKKNFSNRVEIARSILTLRSAEKE